MLSCVLVVIAVLLLAAVARFAERDEPDGMTVHTQADEPRDGEGDDPDVMAEAAA